MARRTAKRIPQAKRTTVRRIPTRTTRRIRTTRRTRTKRRTRTTALLTIPLLENLRPLPVLAPVDLQLALHWFLL